MSDTRERERALDTVARAYRTRKLHPKVWELITKLAHDDFVSGERMSAKYYVEHARRQLRVKADDDGYALNNVTTPVFARMLIREHPEYAYPECPHGLQVRESVVNEVFEDGLRLACAEAIGQEGT